MTCIYIKIWRKTRSKLLKIGLAPTFKMVEIKWKICPSFSKTRALWGKCDTGSHLPFLWKHSRMKREKGVENVIQMQSICI